MDFQKLITKHQLSLVITSIKKLLSFKPNREEVILRSEIEENDALELLGEVGMIEAIAAADGSIYIEDTGVIYTL